MVWKVGTSKELELEYEDAKNFAHLLDSYTPVFLEEDQQGHIKLTRGIQNVKVKGRYGTSSWEVDTDINSNAIKYLEDEDYLEVGSIL